MKHSRRDFLALALGAANGTLTAATNPAIQFVDVAAEAGLREKMIYGGESAVKLILETTGCGVAFFDFDNDGWLDIFLVNGSRLEPITTGRAPSNRLYRNNRNGTFTDITEKAGLIHTGWGQGVAIGDYDNDGFEDLFVTCWGQNILYHNNGDGTFTNVTRKAGLARPGKRWATGCSFIDYDRDGRLDLIVTHYLAFDLEQALERRRSVTCDYLGASVACGPGGFPLEQSALYHNNGDGTFTEVTEKAGILTPEGYYGLGVLTGDFDNDGWQDIYVAADATPSRLFRNNHDGTFREVGVAAGCAYSEDGKPQAGMGVAAGDYDGDGWLDIFKTNFSNQLPNLYRNQRDMSFTDLSARAGMAVNAKLLGWGCGFADFDNDGRLDIFQSNGHIFPELERLNAEITFRQRKAVYRNRGDSRFDDITAVAGEALRRPTVSRGCAFGDFDNDGDVDVLVSNMNDVPSLLRCDQTNGNHWVKVKLKGKESNRSAIGARVRCVTSVSQQIDEVRSGGSYLSQNDLRLHFGLGRMTRIDLLEVFWPNGRIERLRNLSVDRLLLIEEGNGMAREVKFS